MSALPALAALSLAAAATAEAPTLGRVPLAPRAAITAPADPQGQAQAAAPIDPGDQQGEISAAYQAAEAMQGPLDGLWRLDDRDGHTLYIFSLSDAGGPPAPLAASPDHPEVEGAWRDPNRPGAPDASGFIDSVSRRGDWLQIRFVDGPDRPSQTLTLRPGEAGRWTGELDGAAPGRPVVMTRF